METAIFSMSIISMCVFVWNRTQVLYFHEMEQTYNMRYVFGMSGQFLAVAQPIISVPSGYDTFPPGLSRLVSLFDTRSVWRHTVAWAERQQTQMQFAQMERRKRSLPKRC